MIDNPEKHNEIAEALAELCRLRGVETSANILSENLDLSQWHEKPAQMHRAVARAGMNAHVSRSKVKDIPEIALPVALISNEASPLILVSRDAASGTVTLWKESVGRYDAPQDALNEFSDAFTISLRASDPAARRTHGHFSPTKRHWLVDTLLSKKKALLDITVGSIAANLLAVAIALFAMQVYDRVVPNEAFDTLWILASGVGLAILFEFILRMMRSRLVDATGRDIDLALSPEIFSKVLGMRLSSQPASPGVLANQVRDFASIREFLSSSTLTALADIPFAFIFLALISWIGGQVALVVAAGMVLILLPGLLSQKRLARLSKMASKEGAAMNGLLIEAITNLENVKTARCERRFMVEQETLLNKMTETGLVARRNQSLLDQIASSLQQATYASTVVAGVYLISAGSLTVGGLIACTILTSRALSPMTRVAGLLVRAQGARAALEGLDMIMSLPQERPDNTMGVRAPHVTGRIQVEDIKVTAQHLAKPILNIPELRFEAGSSVALLGANGSGKSTLLRILSGFVNPEQGSVILDDLALNQIDPSDRRRHIGFMPQNVTVFQGTLRANIVGDNAYISDLEILEVLDKVGLGAHVRNHAHGLDMVLSPNSLSGGQKQAIGIARLVLQDPKVVLMDEPTAALDNATEALVIKFLKDWSKDRTFIVATHRKEILSIMDTAIILQGGELKHNDTVGNLVSFAQRKKQPAKKDPVQTKEVL